MSDKEYTSYGSDMGIDGKTFNQMAKHYSTKETIFWHEIGHFLYPNERSGAVRLENYYRTQNKINLRAFDNDHPNNPNFIFNF